MSPHPRRAASEKSKVRSKRAGTKTPRKTELPPKVVQVLGAIGQAMRAERLAQNVTLENVALGMGVGRRVVMRMEAGDPTVAVGTWLAALETLRLMYLLSEPKESATPRRRARGAAEPY